MPFLIQDKILHTACWLQTSSMILAFYFHCILHFFVCRPGAFLKATLVWYDYPASPSSLISLVNNLDLEMELNDVVFFANALYYIDPTTLEGIEVGFLFFQEANSYWFCFHIRALTGSTQWNSSLWSKWNLLPTNSTFTVQMFHSALNHMLSCSMEKMQHLRLQLAHVSSTFQINNLHCRNTRHSSLYLQNASLVLHNIVT
jgi:hypothetical protein